MKYLTGSGVADTGTAIHSTWDELAAACCLASFDRKSRADKLAGDWISPADSRTLASVTRLAPFIALDIDREGWSLERLRASPLRLLDAILYTTTQSREAHPRWRVIIRLDREYTPLEYHALRAGLNLLFPGGLDPAKKSPNDIFFMPARWDDSFNHFETFHGFTLEVAPYVAAYPQLVTKWPEMARGATGAAGGQTYPAAPSAPLGSRSRPVNEPVISAYWQSHFHTMEPGGRFFYMMKNTAKRHRLNNWDLNAEELATAALEVSPVDSGGQKRTRKSALREARKAIAWAAQNAQPLTDMERMRQKLQYQQKRKII